MGGGGMWSLFRGEAQNRGGIRAQAICALFWVGGLPIHLLCWKVTTQRTLPRKGCSYWCYLCLISGRRLAYIYFVLEDNFRQPC